jgi:nitrogen fixation protein
MQQLDAIANTEWTTLLETKLEEPIVTVTQEFFVGASILARKWQDRIKHYNSFHQHTLTIVLELGPFFA